MATQPRPEAKSPPVSARLPRRSARSPRKRADEVIEAAAAVFAQRGYHGATTQDIADRLHIRQASLYYYFTSKEDALEAICQRGVEGFIEHASAAARAPGTACDRLSLVIGSHLRATSEKHDFVRVFLSERQHLSDAARRRIGRLSARYEAIIQGIFEAGVASRELRDDLHCRLAALALLALCNSAAAWYGREPGLDLGTIASNFSELLCAGVVSDAARGSGGSAAKRRARRPA
ncbi:MAG: TetR/AcrR family transcriptional regulator [Burkholderiaceae bacterium]|nr:TetR/AcrR family transcriptional regulator [Burkholderiaceae bacterium]